MYVKPFPHFNSLEIVFGKDWAISVHVENLADAASAMEKELHQTMPERVSLINLDSNENNFESQIIEIPAYNTFDVAAQIDQPQGGGTTSRGEKHGRKRTKYTDDVSDNLTTSLSQLGEPYARTTDNIQQLISCFMHEMHTTGRRNQVACIFKEIEGLSTLDMVRAAILITNNNNLHDCFFTMDTLELKRQFVYLVLTNNGTT